jgi:hypothetical protein
MSDINPEEDEDEVDNDTYWEDMDCWEDESQDMMPKYPFEPNKKTVQKNKKFKILQQFNMYQLILFFMPHKIENFPEN